MTPRLPTINAKQLIAVLKKAGFIEVRQKGSHCFLTHPEKDINTTVPIHPGDIGRGLMKKILKDAGLAEDTFWNLF